VILLIVSTIGSLVSAVLIGRERSHVLQAYKEKGEQLEATTRAEELGRKQEGLAKEQERLAKEQEQRAKQQEGVAKEQRQAAEAQKEEAVKQRGISEWNLYIAHMRQAERDWEQGQIGRLHEMLDSHFPQPGQPDLRGWEWYYYLALCHGEARTLFRSSLPARSVAWSPDGKRLATSGDDKKTRVWNASTGQEILALPAAAGSSQVAWSPDGKRLASADDARTATVWDLTAGKAVFTFGGFNRDVVRVAWSPDGDRLAGGDGEGVIKVWDTVKGKEILNLTGAGPTVAWSPDGKRLAIGKATGKYSGDFQIVDAVTGVELLSFSPKGGILWDLAWSPDGKRLASSETGNWVRVWDPAKGRELLKFRHRGTVERVAWSPDGKRLATASWAQRISVWDIATGREVLTLRGHRSAVHFVAWSPDGNQLASAGEDGMVKVWDVSGNRGSPAMEGARAVGLAWSPQGRRLAWAGGRKVSLWDAKGGEQVLMGDVDAKQVAWSPSGKHLAVGKPGGIVVLDVETRRETRTLPSGDAKAISWSPDTTRLAVASGPMIEVWDVANGRKVLSWPRFTLERQPSTYSVPSLAWSPDGTRVASAEDYAVFVWDVATGKKLLALERLWESDNHVYSVAWSPDGKHLAAGGWGVAISVWDASTGRASRILTSHTGAVRLVAWNPDGKRLVSASEDGTVRIWDSSTGQELLWLSGSFAAWSSDGQCLATIGDPDGTIRIWDASPGYVFASGIDYQAEINLARRRASYKRAEDWLQVGAWDEAIADLTEGIRLDPASDSFYNDRAVVYDRRGEYDKAIADYTEAIRLNPRGALSYANRAIAYERKGEYDKAIADFAESLRLDPKLAFSYNNRARLYGNKGETDKAIADFTEDIRLEPRNASNQFFRGQAYLNKAFFNEAEADFKEVLRMEPGSDLGYSYLVDVQLEKGDYDRAIADLVKAIEHEPKDAGFWFMRVLAPLAAGRTDDYRKALAEMIQHFGKSEDPAVARFVSFACVIKPDSGADWQSVLALAERAVRREPGSSACLDALGRVLCRTGSYEQAVQRLSEADRLVRDPSEMAEISPASTWFFLAMTHHRLGHVAEAKKWLDKAGQWVEMDTREMQAGVLERSRFVFNRRLALRLFQEETEALLGAKAAPLADPLPPQSAESHRNRGRELAKNGDLGGAIAAYRAAIRLANPKKPLYFRERGVVYAGKRDMGEALADFREVMRLDKTDPQKLPCSETWLRWLSCWLPAVIQGVEKQPGMVFVSDLPWVKSTSGKGTPEAVRNDGNSGNRILIAGLPYGKGIAAHAFDDARPADVVLDISSDKYTAVKAYVGVLEPGSARFEVLVDGKTRFESEVLRYGYVEPICVEVTGGKEVALRVLNGGDGNNAGSAGWGYARFVPVGREDPLEEPREVCSALEANAALLLTEVHWRLDHKDLARRWYDKAVHWMDRNKGEAEKLRQYHTEAGKLLGITEKPAPAKQQPEKANHQEP